MLDSPLTNLQIELLKLFDLNLKEEELLEVRALLAQYFANKATDEMDALWVEKNWTSQTMQNWLQ
ncbi:MAG: hypothetical protein AAFQ98_22455 [Bacteroidota bacterium]